MNPSALAKKINASPSYITRIEQGEAVPSIKRLYAIAQELGVSITDFFETPTLNYDVFRKTHDKNILYHGKLKDFEYEILLGEHTIFSPHLPFHPYLVKHLKMPQTLFHQHHGWELLILRSGKLKMLFRKKTILGEKEEYLENPLDIILFNAELCHAYIPEGETAESICIISDTNIMNPEVGKNITIQGD